MYYIRKYILWTAEKRIVISIKNSRLGYNLNFNKWPEKDSTLLMFKKTITIKYGTKKYNAIINKYQLVKNSQKE